MAGAETRNSSAGGAHGGCKVAELEMLHPGHVRRVHVTDSREAEIVELAEKRMRTEGDVLGVVDVQLVPPPFGSIFGPEMGG